MILFGRAEADEIRRDNVWISNERGGFFCRWFQVKGKTKFNNSHSTEKYVQRQESMGKANSLLFFLPFILQIIVRFFFLSFRTKIEGKHTFIPHTKWFRMFSFHNK